MSNQPPPIRVADALTALLPAVKVTLLESDRIIQISAPKDIPTEQNITALLPVARSLLPTGWRVNVLGGKLAAPAVAAGADHEHDGPETD